MSAHPIAKIATLQISLVVLSFFVLGLTMKVGGYPHQIDPDIRWNPFAVLLRHYGMWLLLLPPVWAFFCQRAQRSPADCSHSAIVVTGLGTALFIAALFLVAVVLCLLPHSTLIKVSPAPEPKISKRFQAVETPQPTPAEPAHE